MERNLKIERLRKMLARVMPEGGIERLAEDAGALESVAPRPAARGPGDEAEDLARAASQRLARHDDLDDRDIDAIEAIVLPRGRPVIDVISDGYSAPEGLWSGLNTQDTRARILPAIPSVGRVELPGHPQLPFGGTAFVVGTDLLMTNRHVAELFCSGLGQRDLAFLSGRSAAMDFKREIAQASPAPAPVMVHVRKVVMIHPYWDMALLEVDGLPAHHAPLALSTESPEALAGRRVAVIGYPAMDSRNDMSMQLRIFRNEFNVKRLQPGEIVGRRSIRSFENTVDALTHDASTLGGNSGSAVLDVATGKVIGLHFAGRYLDANFAVPTFELARDGRVVDAGVRFDGSLVGSSVPWSPRWDVADPPAGPGETSAARAASVASASGAGRSVTWTIPLEVTVSIGAIDGSSAPRTSLGGGRDGLIRDGGARDGQPAEIEAPKTMPDPDYSGRKGYDDAFLGGAHRVRVPWLSNEQYDDVTFNSMATSSRHILPYHHFSVVMSASRRIAYFTAVNIDGKREMEIERKEFRDNWVLDPRIPAAAQLENEFYKDANGISNPLDRGHLVRRLDPCWGATRPEVLKAHHDTFHWTNCAPQHATFNQSTNLWLGVEGHILENANAENLRVSVFSGPVLDEADPVYRTPTGLQVKLPVEYWKVVVFVRSDGRRSATGYLLSQKVQVDALTEAFDFGDFNNFQVPIALIEERTGLTFRDTKGFDPLDDGTESAAAGRPIPLSSYGTLQL